jgi:hypothetical protein
MPPKQPTVPAERQITGAYFLNNRMELCDCRESKVGFLKTDPTGLEKNHRASRCSFLAVGIGQIESGSHLLSRHLSHAPALKRSFERNDHRCVARNLSFHHHTAVVFLGCDALHREPRGFHAVEGSKQFA